MNTKSPKNLATWISGGIFITFLFFGFALVFEWIPVSYLTVLLVGVGFSVFVFFVVKYVFRTYIEEKIIPIYRVIRKSGVKNQDEQKRSIGSNPIDEIYHEVDDWAQTKNSEIELLKANEKFRQEFIGNVSHELKTPIFNIQGYILTLLEGGLDDPEINHLYLVKAEKSIDRMIQVVKDLEYISRVESGELELVRDDFDLSKLIDEVFDMHEMTAKKNKIKLMPAYRTDQAFIVNADRKRILQVLSNLVINGINYSSGKGYVKIDILDMERHFLIEVADNGLGIPVDDQKRIFERFYRVDKSRSREEGGTGLGLSIAKHFVEAHGQTINIQSEVGRGTAFTFTLNKA